MSPDVAYTSKQIQRKIQNNIAGHLITSFSETLFMINSFRLMLSAVALLFNVDRMPPWYIYIGTTQKLSRLNKYMTEISILPLRPLCD